MLNKNLWLICLMLLVSSVSYAQDADKEAKAAEKKAKKELKKKEKEAKKTKDKGKDKDKDAKADDEEEEWPYPGIRDKEYKDFVKEKHHEQQDKFLDYKYTHPAPPKHKTELGVHLGFLLISGDVKAKATGLNGTPSLGFGVHLRRAFGYVFSARLSYMMGTTHGANWQGAQGWSRDGTNLAVTSTSFAPNAALSGAYYHGQDIRDRYAELNEEFDGKIPDYRGLNSNVVFYNYCTRVRELVLSGIVNLNNIKFHKRENKVNLYGIFGVGGTFYRTMTNQLDGDGNEYDYGTVRNEWNEYTERPDRISDLKDLWDEDYETQAERHFDDMSPIENYSFKPTAHVGIGMGFKLSRGINLALESKVTYTNDDLLDGQRWDEWSGLTRDYDTYTYTGLRLNFNLGAKNSVEPLWWMNPLDYSYQELNKKPCCDDIMENFQDADGDGVPDMFDEEPDSRPDCPVDTKGRMLDSDRDGVLDCDDKQPHTPHYLLDQVDKDGVAMDNCCDELQKQIDELRDLINSGLSNNDPCANLALPSILFDMNRYGVKDAFKAQLATVAGFMKANPSVKMCVVGHTDNRASNPYNEVLSYKRAQEVVNTLVSEFGIPRNNLVIQYRGEGEPVVGGLSDSSASKGIDGNHALNRRVDFRCCDGGMDMARPAGPDAGRR